jgi:hypothetical protein
LRSHVQGPRHSCLEEATEARSSELSAIELMIQPAATRMPPVATTNLGPPGPTDFAVAAIATIFPPGTQLVIGRN